MVVDWKAPAFKEFRTVVGRTKPFYELSEIEKLHLARIYFGISCLCWKSNKLWQAIVVYDGEEIDRQSATANDCLYSVLTKISSKPGKRRIGRKSRVDKDIIVQRVLNNEKQSIIAKEYNISSAYVSYIYHEYLKRKEADARQ